MTTSDARADTVAEACRRGGAEAYAVIDSYGRTVEGHWPVALRTEIFGVMCATLFGAASAASAEMGGASPESVVVRADGRQTILVPYGARAVLCVVAPESATIASFAAVANRFAPVAATG